MVRNTGVQRLLLYSDDFATKSDYSAAGSNGGCCMIRMNLPPCDIRSSFAVRTISVTPPGVSTNRVIAAIIPDLVKGSTKGVKGLLPSGQKLRNFLDGLGFIGDYPASCHVIDSKTNTASALCTPCNFKPYVGPQTRASKFRYTVAVNAKNSSALRCGDRQMALGESGIDDETARTLVMTSSSTLNDTDGPLIALQREMTKHLGQEVRNSNDEKIAPTIFDAYRSNLVALDNFLTGIAKNILSLLLELTPTRLRSQIDIQICDELKKKGLLRQRTILKSNGKCLASMSLTGVFSTLAVAMPVFHINFRSAPEIGSNHALAMRIAAKLPTLISRTYWSPQLQVDGHFAVSKRDEGNRELYLADLRQKAEDYIRSANDLCITSTIVAKHLDKLNLQRLLELYLCKLPAFGYVKHFKELVFVTAHQPLKRCIVQGNHKDDYLSAVEHSLGHDWQARLMLLRRQGGNSDRRVRKGAMRVLRRLLLGKESDVDEGENEDESDNALLEVFKEPITEI